MSVTLSDADKRILRAIQRDASLGLKDLAEVLAMSSSTVWRRLQELENAGIITGRVTLVDGEKLGLDVTTLVHVNMSDQTAEARAEFERFAEISENIQQCYAVTGAHDYIVVVRMASVRDYERFLMDHLLAHPSVASAQSQLILRECKNSTVLPI